MRRLFLSIACTGLLNVSMAAQDAVPVQSLMLEGGSPSVADRAQTATITQVNFTPTGLVIDFTKRDGPGRWPDVVPPGWDGPLQYTVWIGMQLQGQWHVCAVLEFWYGRGLWADQDAGGDATSNQQIQRNWTYFCGPLARQPNPGEPVLFLVTAGDQRRMDVAAVRERSNLVVIPFPASAPAVFPMGSIPTPIPTPTPVPTPSPVPAPPPVPAPLPTPGPIPPLVGTVDLSPMLNQMAINQQQVLAAIADVKKDVAEFRAAVRSKWAAFVNHPIVKYGSAIALGWLTRLAVVNQ